MGAIIAKATIERIRDANDIVEVVSSHLPLKRTGRTFKALCPFHKEKTPSFHVNPERQIFHCFGCDTGGDVFRFIMNYEGVDFPTAARILAERAGLRIEWDSGSDKERDDKEILYRIHESAAAFFHRTLLQHECGAGARQYLREREIDTQTIESFRLGYAPPAWSSMLQFGRKHGFTERQLETAGMLSRSERTGRAYDRFRDRLTIPVHDAAGRVIGFTARTLQNESRGAKYINSPETPLFHKGRILFALDRARRAILDQRRAVLCEGQLDVIRCHQAGLAWCVAAQGTALTDDHARLLKRYADEVILVMDPDAAGIESAMRAAEPFISAGLRLRIARLPDGEDPDLLIRKHGIEPLRRAVDEAVDALDFQIDVFRNREDLRTPAVLARVCRRLLQVAQHAPSEIERDQLIHRIAERLEVREEVLRREARRGSRPAAEKAQSSPSGGHPPEEEALLELALNHPGIPRMARKYLQPRMLRDAVCRRLLEEILARADKEAADIPPPDPGDSPEYVRLATRLQTVPSRFDNSEIPPQQACRDLILVIRRKALEREREELRRELRANPTPDLRRRSIELTHDINLLRQGWEHARLLLEIGD